jgi:hypothetical protein
MMIQCRPTGGPGALLLTCVCLQHGAEPLFSSRPHMPRHSAWCCVPPQRRQRDAHSNACVDLQRGFWVKVVYFALHGAFLAAFYSVKTSTLYVKGQLDNGVQGCLWVLLVSVHALCANDLRQLGAMSSQPV